MESDVGECWRASDKKFNSAAQWIMDQMIYWKRETMDRVQLEIIEDDPIAEAIFSKAKKQNKRKREIKEMSCNLR